MSADRRTQAENRVAPSGSPTPADNHWLRRTDPAGAADPAAHQQWCDDRLVQLLAEPLPTRTVQRDGGDGGAPAAQVHAAAARGIATPSSAMPHGETIQAAFGTHDVSHVQAHVGGGAADACADMGATAFASDGHVAFARSPDLHTAAHEAAHVVQQARGVNLYGGIGEVGDAYEAHADQVADQVVAGGSAESLLSSGPGPGAATTVDPAAPDGGPAVEADEGDEAGGTSAELVSGKPPKAVQQKARGKKAKVQTIEQATAKYAPLVFLAPGEEYGMTDASEYVKNSRLRWSHDSGRRDHQLADQGQIDEDRLGSGGYEHQVEGRFGGHHGDPIHSDEDSRPKDGKGAGGDEGFFLDLDNSKRKQLGANKNPPVYHEAVNGRYITYWFFYSYNPGPTSTEFDNHEGDWERIVVKLDRRNRATAVGYYQHNGPPHEKAWRDVPKQGTHPLVFSAKGSHASFSSAGKHDIGIPGIKDTTGRGRQIKTWRNLKAAKDQGWYGYGGAWGEVGEIKNTTGPQGPSAHKPAAPEDW